MSHGKAVRVRGLRKSYGGKVAVAGVDLDIDYGECFALLGPNGAGKTTTVEILEGHRVKDAGEVHIGASKAEIGIVLQEANDAGDLTVYEMVSHFAGYYPHPREPMELIEFVGLPARHRIRTLSGGQRRRLDVALGLVGRPRLLFLDEPTTGFDPEARRQFWGLIKALEGTTILLTTHYLEEAEALADRVAVIAAGLIVAEGEPATLGGRATAKATVRWQEHGTTMEALTDDPVRYVREHRGDMPGLTVTRPSLEDIYLELIGEHNDSRL
ncbi:MAG TPA: ABC transporter ATP-binding protein [Candidatus Limnocylindrales bacterium]|nr:ABC transporter ATP-binding protein [Candidatus Limnocylindrales bacterium]